MSTRNVLRHSVVPAVALSHVRLSFPSPLLPFFQQGWAALLVHGARTKLGDPGDLPEFEGEIGKSFRVKRD